MEAIKLRIRRFFSRTSCSKDIARDRLKLLLVKDRIDFSSGTLETMKLDIIKVVSNYMEIEEENFNIEISKEENEFGTENLPVIHTNIPIKSLRKSI